MILIPIGLAFDTNGTSWFVGAGFTLIGFPNPDIDKPALPSGVIYKTWGLGYSDVLHATEKRYIARSLALLRWGSRRSHLY